MTWPWTNRTPPVGHTFTVTFAPYPGAGVAVPWSELINAAGREGVGRSIHEVDPFIETVSAEKLHGFLVAARNYRRAIKAPHYGPVDSTNDCEDTAARLVQYARECCRLSGSRHGCGIFPMFCHHPSGPHIMAGCLLQIPGNHPPELRVLEPSWNDVPIELTVEGYEKRFTARGLKLLMA